MLGKKKKKYGHHLSIRIAIAIMLILLLVQLIALAANAIGLFAASLLRNGTDFLRMGEFLQYSVDADIFTESIETGEKTVDVEEEEIILRGYAFALDKVLDRLTLFTGDDDKGYRILIDISGKGQKEHEFLDEIKNIPAGAVEKIFYQEKKNTDEKNSIISTVSDSVELNRLSKKLTGSDDVSIQVYPGLLKSDKGGKDVYYVLSIDPMGMFEASAVGMFMLVVVTLISTVIILVVLIFWINHRVVSPMKKIKQAAVDFTSQMQENDNPGEWTYQAPRIKTRDEIHELGDTVQDMAEKIRSSVETILSDAKEKERVGIEMELASGIQNSMLPSTFPAFPDRKEFDIYASMNPAREVGGDFYDFAMLDDSHLCMTIADVSGKGVPASLFMMSSMLILSSLAHERLLPSEILAKANDQIASSNKANMFVTVWIGILDLNTGVLRAANAGHEYPAVMKAGEGYSLLKDKHGFVIGELENMKYHDYEIQLNPGDAIFVYTDGVPEANNEKQEMFGTRRMLKTLNRTYGETPEKQLNAMTAALHEFCGNANQFDDVTMLCVKYLGPVEKQEEEGAESE